MDVKGHPKRPLEREALPIEQLAESFLAQTREEQPALHGYLAELDEEGRRLLAGVLGRFDTKGRGELDAQGRLLARRILGRLHRPSGASLKLTNRVLDYLDLNRNALLEEGELELCIEIMELFARVDSSNDTLSEFELEELYAVLRHIDTNDNGVLDPNEKARLRQGLDDPESFLAEQQATNPRLRKLLVSRGARP
jgi:hypothetical protein